LITAEGLYQGCTLPANASAQVSAALMDG